MPDATPITQGDTAQTRSALATPDSTSPRDPLAPGGIPPELQDRMLQNAQALTQRQEQYMGQEAAVKAPPLPKLGKVGPPPQNDIRGDAIAWLGFATAIGGIAGAMTKHSSMNALAAFSGTLDGLREGNQQKFNDNFKTWEAQAKATQENNKVEMDGYRNILERQDLDHRQRADQLEMFATQNRNKFMIELARASKKDPALFTAALDSISAKTDKGNDAMARLLEARARSRDAAQERADVAKQQRQEKADEARSMVVDVLDDMATGKQSPFPTGIYGQNRLILEQEAHKKGIDLSRLQMQWRSAENLNRSLSSVQRANMYAYGDRYTTQTVPRLKELSDELNLANAPFLNWGQLQILQNQSGPRAQLAAQYIAQIRIAQEDIAQLAKGGYSPTNIYLDFAKGAINENMEVKNLQAALEEETRGVAFTINAFSSQGAGVIGPTAPNLFLGGKPPIDVSKSGIVSGSTSVPPPADALQQARDAISKGAPRDAVIQRLRERGIDAGGL